MIISLLFVTFELFQVYFLIDIYDIIILFISIFAILLRALARLILFFLFLLLFFNVVQHFQFVIRFFEEVALEAFSLLKSTFFSLIHKLGLQKKMLSESVLINLMNEVVRLPEVYFGIATSASNFLSALCLQISDILQTKMLELPKNEQRDFLFAFY